MIQKTRQIKYFHVDPNYAQKLPPYRSNPCIEITSVSIQSHAKKFTVDTSELQNHNSKLIHGLFIGFLGREFL